MVAAPAMSQDEGSVAAMCREPRLQPNIPAGPQALLDPAAAGHYITLIKHGGLSGRDGSLGAVKAHLDAVISRPWNECRAGRNVLVANLDLCSHSVPVTVRC